MAFINLSSLLDGRNQGNEDLALSRSVHSRIDEIPFEGGKSLREMVLPLVEHSLEKSKESLDKVILMIRDILDEAGFDDEFKEYIPLVNPSFKDRVIGSLVAAIVNSATSLSISWRTEKINEIVSNAISSGIIGYSIEPSEKLNSLLPPQIQANSENPYAVLGYYLALKSSSFKDNLITIWENRKSDILRLILCFDGHYGNIANIPVLMTMDDNTNGYLLKDVSSFMSHEEFSDFSRQLIGISAKIIQHLITNSKSTDSLSKIEDYIHNGNEDEASSSIALSDRSEQFVKDVLEELSVEDKKKLRMWVVSETLHWSASQSSNWYRYFGLCNDESVISNLLIANKEVILDDFVVGSGSFKSVEYTIDKDFLDYQQGAWSGYGATYENVQEVLWSVLPKTEDDLPYIEVTLNSGRQFKVIRPLMASTLSLSSLWDMRSHDTDDNGGDKWVLHPVMEYRVDYRII
jgi:hypothetical protein